MTAVDTSALMAIVLDEPTADACMASLEAADELVISAVTLAEALIVAGRRGVGEEMARLVEGLGFEVVDATPATARRVAEAYARWGKGRHAAALNFGDCFSYVLAAERMADLLYVGDDFRLTDVRSAS